MAITFTALGTIASLLGKLLNIGTAPWWYIILGLLMIAMALHTWGIITLIPPSYAQSKNRKKGYVGALVTGILGGLFSSPCATPVLIALLALVARETNPLWGTFLLLLYSIGHGILSVGAGTFIGFTGKLSRSSRYGFFCPGCKYRFRSLYFDSRIVPAVSRFLGGSYVPIYISRLFWF